MTTPASPKAALMPSVIEFACKTIDDVDLFNESIDGIVKQQLGRRAGHPAYANRPAPRLLVSQDSGAVFVSVGDTPVGVSQRLPVTVRVTPADTFKTELA
jgi:hypothetical protein